MRQNDGIGVVASATFAVRRPGRRATIDLSESFAAGGGSLSTAARLAQLVFTLTELSAVDEVVLRLDLTLRFSATLYARGALIVTAGNWSAEIPLGAP